MTTDTFTGYPVPIGAIRTWVDREGVIHQEALAMHEVYLDEDRRCPHDGLRCTHDCEGDDCWRELDGS